jgi:drug/metabolite transporter (DMT)-like permease
LRWALGAALALAAGYILCGHVFLFLHGMGQWPIILFVVGLIVIGIAAISNRQKVMMLVVAGYVVGFAAGMLLNWDTHHPYRAPGVYTNNNWLIWTAVYLVFIGVGIVWEVVAGVKRRQKNAVMTTV